MLKRVALKNFKLFDETGITVDFGKITVLIGANGTGKSSVLQALTMLKQSLLEPNNDTLSSIRLHGSLINLGDFRDVVHQQDLDRVMAISFLVRQHLPKNIPNPIEGGRRDIDGKREDNRQLGSLGYDISLMSSGNGHRNMRSIKVQSDISGNLVDIEEIDQNTNSLSPRVLLSFYFIPAIRGFDHIAYDLLDGLAPDDVSSAGGPEKQAGLAAHLVASRPELADEISGWLQRILDSKSRLRSRLWQNRIRGEMANGRKSIALPNEAFGLNQLITPLLWMKRSPRGSMIAIEEPEIHLHPRAQARLSDIFVEVSDEEEKQFILTTHSEHILMALLTAVAEGRMRPDDLAIYEFRREGDTANAERLAVNKYGQVAGGLPGFLEVELEGFERYLATRFQPQSQ